MATLSSTRRTPWVRGPSSVIDAMVIGGTSTDHLVYFERVVPHAGFTLAKAQAIVDQIGAAIDTVLNNGTAIAASFSQEPDASGLLANYMEFTFTLVVGENAADFTSTALVPMQIIFDQGVAGIDNALNDERSALAGRVQ